MWLCHYLYLFLLLPVHQITKGSSSLIEKTLLPLDLFWRRYFLLRTWHGSATEKSSLIINLKKTFTNNKPQKSLLHQRHWLLCECWLLVIIKLQKCFFVMSLMYCNTVGFERSTGSNFENLENHYTRDNGFFPVVAVDNQKMGLNGLEVEVASWIILLFFLLKLPGKKETKPPFFISVDTWFPTVTSAKPSSLDMQPLQTFLAVVLNQWV